MQEINNVKKIGVLSDTHTGSRSAGLSGRFFDIFKDTDLILHAGDFTSPDIIIELETISPVIGVKGNMDSSDIRYPAEEMLKINGKYTIALCHGAGMHMTTKTRMYKKFSEYKPNIIIYGHTHRAEIEDKNGIIMFNPGSPAAGSLGASAGIINVAEKGLKPEIIFFREDSK